MKAMRQPRLTSLLLAAAVAAMLSAATAQALTVSNIRTAQRANDGAIIVTYDLSATNACEVAVTFKAGGIPLAARTLSGDVGPGVAAGTDKSIVWDAPSDLPMTVVADAVATVTAYGSPIPEEGVQLWENGPYWAECNVGAEHSWDFGLRRDPGACGQLRLDPDFDQRRQRLPGGGSGRLCRRSHLPARRRIRHRGRPSRRRLRRLLLVVRPGR